MTSFREQRRQARPVGRTCRQCGINIDARATNALYCGSKCSSRAARNKHYKPTPKPPASCRMCRREFAKKGNAVTCSVECRKKLTNLRIRLNQYRLPISDYFAMLDAQGGMCAICGSPGGSFDRFGLSIDHCHASGDVRGLLCARCNSGVGLFRDNSEFLRSAAEYLDTHYGQRKDDCA